MAGVNKVIILGRLGQDPEIRYAQNGNVIANLTVATSEKWRDKQTGENKESVEWHRVVLFGKVAEIAGEYLRKGSEAYFEGKLKTRKWQDQSGQDKYTTEIVVDVGGTMQLIGGGGNGGGQQNQGGNQQRQQSGGQQRQQPQQQRQNNGGAQNNGWGSNEPPMDFDSDIPF